MLSQVLGYRNVRFYDGSIEEWAEDANAPVVKFSWN
jgi:3-mercaptopyruvate sulfurtransferase SseA